MKLVPFFAKLLNKIEGIKSINAYKVLRAIIFPLMFKIYKSKAHLKKRDKYQTKPQLARYMGRTYQKLNHQ